MELLVVIGIIAMLIGLLLPSLSRARESSRSVACAANLHQIGVAVFNYAIDNAGGTPAWSGWHVYPEGSSPESDPGPGWTEEIRSKMGVASDSRVYNCPAFPEGVPQNYFITGRWAYAQGRNNIKLSRVQLSSLFVMGGEVTNRGLYAPPFGTAPKTTIDCDKDDASGECLLFANSAGGLNLHTAGNNVLFSDGHVSLFRRFDSTQMTYDGTRQLQWADVHP